MLRRIGWGLLLLVGSGCASGGQIVKPDAEGRIPGRTDIPTELQTFCRDNCSENEQGYAMLDARCFDECVKDLLNKQGAFRHPKTPALYLPTALQR